MSDSIKKKIKGNFVPHLIEQVQQRPIIWDKNHQHRTHRRKVAQEWEYLEAMYGKPVAVLKSKWRNIKDTFHRETRKMTLPPIELRDKPITEYYEGQWQYFESLLFLWDEDRHGREVNENENENQNDDGFLTMELSAEMQNQLKCEFTDSDVTDMDNENDRESVEDKDNVSYNDDMDPIATDSKKKKRPYSIKHDKETPAKIRLIEANGERSINEIDEDMHFAKSLVPFMRNLNPVRKLIVRNEIHSLLLKELLCIRCRTKGPQPDCLCNYK